MTRRHIWHGGRWVDVTDAPRRPRVGPYIVRDGMAPAVHPATGQIFDSKSAFRSITRAHGLVEVGNDAPTAPLRPAVDLGDVKASVAEAYSMLEQGYHPPPVETADAETRIYT